MQQIELQAPVGFIWSRKWGLFPVPEKVPRDHRGDTGRLRLASRVSSLSLSSQLPGWKAEGVTSQPWLSSWRGQGVHLELLTPHLLTDSQQLKTGERCRQQGVGKKHVYTVEATVQSGLWWTPGARSSAPHTRRRLVPSRAGRTRAVHPLTQLHFFSAGTPKPVMLPGCPPGQPLSPYRK